MTCTGATGIAAARLSKEESRAMKCYVYHQQILCNPNALQAVLNDVNNLLLSSKAKSDEKETASDFKLPEGDDCSKRAKLG